MDRTTDQLNLLYELLYYVLYNSHDPAKVAWYALLLLHKSLAIVWGEIHHLNEHHQLELLATAGYEEVNSISYEGWERECFDQHVIIRVLEDGKGVILPGEAGQGLWQPFSELDKKIRSIAVFPLSVTTESRGVMTLLSSEPDYFTQERVSFLTAVAPNIALALQNGYRFDQALQEKNQLRLWVNQLLIDHEAEHRRLSHSLQDEIGQTLTLLQIHLSAIKSDLSVLSPSHTKVGKTQEVLGEVMLQLNQMAYGLRPPELELLGLNAALAALCQEFRPQAELSISYSGVENLPTLPDVAGISFYHCLQEVLTIVDKYAQASHIDVTLDYDQFFIYLHVKDNGIGLKAMQNTAVRQTGIRLTGMRERFKNMRGFMKAHSEPGRGMTLIMGIPRQDNGQGT